MHPKTLLNKIQQITYCLYQVTKITNKVSNNKMNSIQISYKMNTNIHEFEKQSYI